MEPNLLQKIIIGLPGIFTAIVFHEVAHGYVSYKFSDPTAKNAGRLTLNPLPHIDLFGTIIFPCLCLLTGGLLFGWAKPVPIDPRYYKNVKKSIFWVSFAGPLANYITALLAMVLMIVLSKYFANFFLTEQLILIFSSIMKFNFGIGTFNLIPVPPLDGSKMVSCFLNYNAQIKYNQLERYGFFIIIGLILLEDNGLRTISYFFEPFQLFFNYLFNVMYHLL